MSPSLSLSGANSRSLHEEADSSSSVVGISSGGNNIINTHHSIASHALNETSNYSSHHIGNLTIESTDHSARNITASHQNSSSIINSHNQTITTIAQNITNSANGDDYRSYFTPPKMDNLVDVFSICCSTAVIFGGLIPYIPQYLKIKDSLNSDGFSTYVCLTLLIANIMRIMFWFGHHFELPLLIQSFVMIAGMLAMMEICIRVRDKSSSYMISAIGGSSGPNRRRRFLNGWTGSQTIYSVLGNGINNDSTPNVVGVEANGQESAYNSVSYQNQSKSCQVTTSQSMRHQPSTSASIGSLNRSLPTGNENLKCSNLRDFWDWDDLFSYLKFLILFTLIVGMITYLLIDNYIYIETIGFIAVLTESMLGMPQLLRNHSKKSTRGMSVAMVIMWLSGDLFKTLYFILRKAPTQFYICGSIQVMVDILILLQVIWYRRAAATYRKLPKST